MDLSKFSRDDWIVASIALLLAIDLLFLPWISVNLGIFGVGSSTGTGWPSGWLGVIAVLAALALVVDVALDRLASHHYVVPAIGGSRASTRVLLAVVAAGCVALKFLFNVSVTTNYWAFGFWAAIVLAAALIVVTVRARQAEATGVTPWSRS